jgi:hypothetical protein
MWRVIWLQGLDILASAMTEQAVIINVERQWQLTAKLY